MSSVVITRAARDDGPDLIAANRASIDFHRPWARPFIDAASFETWLTRTAEEENACFVARLAPTRAVIGVVSLSQIFLRDFRSAYLGYYGHVALAGRGLMTQAVGLVLDHGFRDIGLNRIEANIQPGNSRSIALARRIGFRLEGFSPAYLRIEGEWRDHERWAMLARDWAGSERLQADGVGR